MEQTTSNSGVLSALSTQMADAVERVSPAIVTVHGRERQPASGLVYGHDLVLTADHVIEREDGLTVSTHDERTLPATIVGRDPASDLALLKVPGLDLSAVQVAGASARVGQFVLSVGRTSGDGPMASSGVVSAVGGPLRGREGVLLESYIHTDATPYPGFSGGALIDTQGTLLGVITTGLVNGATLAIPTADAWRIAEALEKHGRVRRGYLGVASEPTELSEGQRREYKHERGLQVIRLEPGGPAEQSGLQTGDVIVSFDGQPLNNSDHLLALLFGDRVGAIVPVEVVRGDELRTVQVTVGERKLNGAYP